jgi:hypothetical protein
VKRRRAPGEPSPCPVAFVPCSGWSALIGGTVQVRRDGLVVQTGTVEAAMPDDSALWLEATATEPRRCFARSEGYEAWISPRHLQPSAPTPAAAQG